MSNVRVVEGKQTARKVVSPLEKSSVGCVVEIISSVMYCFPGDVGGRVPRDDGKPCAFGSYTNQ